MRGLLGSTIRPGLTGLGVGGGCGRGAWKENDCREANGKAGGGKQKMLSEKWE